MEWKWSNGEKYEKSQRLNHKNLIEDSNSHTNHEQDAYASSLNYDENTWEVLNQSLAKHGIEQINKRELIDDKLSNRQYIHQTGTNPFLDNRDYVDNIDVSNQYLKPLNTNEEIGLKKTETVSNVSN